jgi:hypothetical protein
MTDVRSGETDTLDEVSSGATALPTSSDVLRDISTPDAQEPQLFCPQCGYNLHGIEDATRCPECGLVIDRQGFARSRLPWVHRRHVGRFRAYWRTVLLATLRPRDVAAEAARPVAYADAQRFRYVTAAAATLPFVVALVAGTIWYGSTGFVTVIRPDYVGAALMGGRPLPMFDVAVPWESGATLHGVLPLALFLAAVFVTGVASYWFHPKHLPVVRQNRAIALSYYACAPLAFAAIPVALAFAIVAMKIAGLDNQANASWTVVRVLEIALVITSSLILAAFWRSTMSLLRHTTQSGPGRLTLAALLIPLKWLLLAVVTLFAVPWVIGYLRLVITSL